MQRSENGGNAELGELVFIIESDIIFDVPHAVTE
jgi:hypothetical protein